jgi:hypothetical protein
MSHALMSLVHIVACCGVQFDSIIVMGYFEFYALLI